ncbi:KIAA1841-like protein [Scenedesmus sp. PABB004]|nr:KIAA1841-like protein [Scenedesmus sp. PABB004]
MGVVTVELLDDGAAADGAAADGAGGAATCRYRCDARLLCSQMPFFAEHLAGLPPGQDAVLTVACARPTWEFVLAQAKAAAGLAPAPALSAGNVLPVLAAAHYLRMTALADDAVGFVSRNLCALAARAAVDLRGLDDALVGRIAQAAREEELEALLAQGGASAALAQALFKRRLQALLRGEASVLLRCAACGRLFSAGHHALLRCTAAAGAGAGERLALHVPDPGWRLAQFLAAARRPCQPDGGARPGEQRGAACVSPWRELYWLVWGSVVVQRCAACGEHYAPRQHSHCAFHPLPAVFANEAAHGVHPCCGRPAWRPGAPPAESAACAAREHQPSTDQVRRRAGAGDGRALAPRRAAACQGKAQPCRRSQEGAARALQLLRRFGSCIAEPFAPPPPAVPAGGAVPGAGAGAGKGSGRDCVCTGDGGPDDRSASHAGVGGAADGELAAAATRRVDRRVLLELLRADDARRMGLLMRRLDAGRLQPPPTGAAAVEGGGAVGPAAWARGRSV